MTTLKPCPFCGSKSRWEHAIDATCREQERMGAHRDFYYVFCEDCEASGPTDYVQANAIDKWNTRCEPTSNE